MISKLSSFLPFFSSASSHVGLRPRPVHVCEGSAGFRYLGFPGRFLLLERCAATSSGFVPAPATSPSICDRTFFFSSRWSCLIRVSMSLASPLSSSSVRFAMSSLAILLPPLLVSHSQERVYRSMTACMLAAARATVMEGRERRRGLRDCGALSFCATVEETERNRYPLARNRSPPMPD